MLVPLHAYYSRIVSSCRAPTFISKNLARQNLQLTFPLFLPHVFPANAKCKIARPNTPPLLNVCVCFGCMCATIILWNPTNTRKKDFAEIHFLKINKSNSTFIKYTFFFFKKSKTTFFRVLFLEIQNGKSFLFYCASCLCFSAFVLPQPAARVIFTVCRSWLLCLTKVSVYVCVRVSVSVWTSGSEKKFITFIRLFCAFLSFLLRFCLSAVKRKEALRLFKSGYLGVCGWVESCVF